MLTLVWRESALSELEGIITYIQDRDFAAGQRLRMHVENCAERLVDHPYMHRVGRLAGTREAIVHPNYIVVYRVTADAIEILNVLHARQQYP